MGTSTTFLINAFALSWVLALTAAQVRLSPRQGYVLR